ncbi:MAG TPA: sensor histidine kinase [Polyangiaceae bacterium]|nr:sensor histidine kinase [Polyangiaceae bacterium]
MSKGRLTRQELGWLLTQEAQGAAERLRVGVSALTQAPPAPDADTGAMDATLSALDDTMKMLSSLHARPVGMRARRGRIDLASLIWEVAPEARVSIEPGSGTEVFGDEAELRRMLLVMLGHGSGTGSTVVIRREGDEVAVGVVLGPDSSATADTERAWLSRMAIRYGGRYELEGSMEVLGLPADGVESRDDLASLRRELEEARKQGEAYARELGAAWSGGDEALPGSTFPPGDPHAEAMRYGAVTRLAGGIAATLRSMLSPVGRELAELRQAMSPRKSSPDLEMVARAGLEERLESMRRKLIAVQEFVAELAAVGENDGAEPARIVDLAAALRVEVQALDARAGRNGVRVRTEISAASAIEVRVPPRAVGALFREVVAHAIAASGPNGSVVVALRPAGDSIGARLVVDDSGTILPAGARRALLALEVEPGTFGRPSGVALFVAAEITHALGGLLEVGDAPAERGGGGGVRVTVTFPR